MNVKRFSFVKATSAIALAVATALGAYAAAADVELNPRRLQQWVQRGGDHEVVHLTFHRIDRFGADGPGSWVHEWSAVGDYYMEKARSAEQAGDTAEARDAYLVAAVYYSAAKFPDNATEAQRAAFAKHLDAYKKAGRYFDVPLETIEIDYEGATVTGFLHLPRGVDKPPLVIWSNGIDTHKADTYLRILPTLEKGLAVMTVDSPGTGENNRRPARPESSRMYSHILEEMQDDDRVDATRIGQVGISFGGYFAARQAFVEPRLDAAAVLCAPIHGGLQLSPDAPPEGEGESMAALEQAVGVERGNRKELAETVRSFSLEAQGLLGNERIETPLLVANGNKDSLVPVSDLTRLAEAGDNAELWILGGSGHCAGDYADILYPKLADWLARHLTSEQAAGL